MAQNLRSIIRIIKTALKRSRSFLLHVVLPRTAKASALVIHPLPIFLTFLFLMFGVLGLLFYRAALPPRLETESLPTPARLDVFVSDPSARVELTVKFGFQGSVPPAPGAVLENGQWLASVYISVIPRIPSLSVRWIVEIHGAATNAYRLPSSQIPLSSSRAMVDVFEGETLPGKSAAQDQNGIPVGYFVAQPLEVSRGNLVVRMPDLAPESYTFSGAAVPVFAIGNPAPLKSGPGGSPSAPPAAPLPPLPIPPPPPPPGSGKISLSPGPTLSNQIQLSPNLNGQSPRFTALPVGDILTEYYSPQAVITSDQLNVPLTQYQPITNYPSNASFSSSGVAWQGVGELSPTLTAIELGVSDTRGNYTFIAGVALAIAASALIALLQELDAERRRNKDSADKPIPRPPDGSIPIT